MCCFDMPMKLFMTPQTVPNNPTNGAVAPIVAEHARRARHAPPGPRLEPVEPRCNALLEAAGVEARGGAQFLLRLVHRRLEPALASSACGRLGERRRPLQDARSDWLNLRAPIASSIPLTSATVQVTNDAKARPTITALTKTSADRNMPHGERSARRERRGDRRLRRRLRGRDSRPKASMPNMNDAAVPTARRRRVAIAVVRRRFVGRLDATITGLATG